MKNNYSYSVRGDESSIVCPDFSKAKNSNPKTGDERFDTIASIMEKGNESVLATNSFPKDIVNHIQAITKELVETVGTNNAKYLGQLELLAPAILAPGVPILILGETGSGKNHLVSIIHKTSKGKDSPFIHINCGSLTDELLLSELFGHEKGSFSGANNLKKGLVELANDGILFLDEVDKAGKRTRHALLKFLDNGSFFRVGGQEELSSNTRIICGSNQDLHLMVENNLFEREFYERIAGLKMIIPPLRERKEDLESLVLSKCKAINDNQSKILSITMRQNVQINFRVEPEALEVLRMYPFPGNVRELFNIIDNVYLKCFKHNTQIASKSIVLECLPSSTINRRQGSLHPLEKELRDMFMDWYQTEYLHSDEKVSNNSNNSNIKPGFLQKKLNPILAHIYESINPDELGLSKTDKDKMARKLIGIGGQPSGKEKSTLLKYLQEYDQLPK